MVKWPQHKPGEVAVLWPLPTALSHAPVQSQIRKRTLDTLPRLRAQGPLGVGPGAGQRHPAPHATIIKLNGLTCITVPNLHGLSFLPATGPLGTAHTVSNSRPEKGPTILQ